MDGFARKIETRLKIALGGKQFRIRFVRRSFRNTRTGAPRCKPSDRKTVIIISG